jgi:hypothetical protein
MLTHLPLDDELNQRFYVDDGVWRLVWANALGDCVLRREKAHLDVVDAVTMIAHGELLWAPPERFEPLAADTPVDEVRREYILLRAFLRSPAGQRLTRWTMRLRLELRTSADQDWLTNRALTGGDTDTQSGSK